MLESIGMVKNAGYYTYNVYAPMHTQVTCYIENNIWDIYDDYYGDVSNIPFYPDSLDDVKKIIDLLTKK